MKKKIISGLMVCVVIVLSFFYSHIDKNSYLYERNTDSGMFYGTGILLDGEEIRQTFISKENSIDGINIKLATTGNLEDIVLKYSVLDEMNQELAHNTVVGSELENNKFNQLDIPTIGETLGKKYTLVLCVESSDEQNGVGFYVEPRQRENQHLTIKDDMTDGTLVVRIISHRFDVETFVMLLAIIVFVVMFMKILYKFFK